MFTIEAEWFDPIEIQKSKKRKQGYICERIAELPNTPGVYAFITKDGNYSRALYIGQSVNVRGRLEKYLKEANRVMTALAGRASGAILFVGCAVYLKNKSSVIRLNPKTKKCKNVLNMVEIALIGHAIAKGHVLVNIQRTKRQRIRFSS